MVRFSDMLGNGEGDEPSAPTAARDTAPDVDEQPDPDAPHEKGTVQFVDQVGATPPAAPAEPQSPQDVLDRLTQYATRAADRAPAPDPPAADSLPPQPPAAVRERDEPPDPAPRPSVDPEEPVGDDLLPRARRTLRKPGRGDKRRP
jgi:hypothetical protein